MAPNASSSKEQTAKGAKVTTVATSSAASDGGVPSTLTLEVPKGGKAGFLWADKGGGVSKITAGGLADKSGVKVGWRLAKVVMTDVTGATLGKQVGGLIAAAQKTGKPFKLTFEPPASSFSSPSSATPAAAASSASSAPAATPEDEDAAAKKAAEEEEAARKAAEAEVERLAAEEAARVEAERKKAAGNGVVKMLYNMYDEEFEIKDGSTKAENIDELYCLSDVMPGCTIHLSKVSPAEYTKRVQDDAAFEVPYEKEEPWGVFQELEVATEGHGNGQYHVHVVQNAANEAQERRLMEAQWAANAAAEAAAAAAAGERFHVLKDLYANEGLVETCSCIYGNPCVDEYGCKDWTNRYAVATKNGWKGF